MARPPKPWWRESRKAYYATINGVCHRLGRNIRSAERKLKELESERSVGGPRGSVAGAVQKFIDFIFRKKKDTPQTAEWYFKHLKPFVESVGKLSVSELQTHHIQEWIDSHENWSAGTKHGAWRAIHRALKWAVKQGHMIRNPAEDVEKEPAPRRELVIPESDYKKILELSKDEEFRDVIRVAWECGPRAQELLPLEIRHLDMAESRAIYPRDEAKGKKRPRFLYFTPKAMAIVRRRSGRRKDGYVFLNTDGQPWTPFSVGCRFARLQKKLGARYCLTNFRHTWQNRLLKSCVDPITVATLAGHVDKSMLANIYSHLDQDPAYLRGALSRASGASGAPRKRARAFPVAS